MRTLVHGLGQAAGEADAGWLEKFAAPVNDDLNTPRALAVLWELLRSTLPDGVKKATVLRFDAALGLDLANWQPALVAVPEQVHQWMAQREVARRERRWDDADGLRARVREAGYEIDDTAQGPVARSLPAPTAG